MERLIETVRMLSKKEAELLEHDKLPKSKIIKTGLYLVIYSTNDFIAYDYNERQSWGEYFGFKKNIPQGYKKIFNDPLTAIDWLLENRK